VKFSDGIFGLAFAAFGGWLIVHAAGFPTPPGNAYGPGFFPTILGAALAIAGVVLALPSLLARDPLLVLADWARSPGGWLRLAMVPGVVLAYLALAPRAGFLAAATLPTALLLAWLTRRPLLGIAVAAGSALAVWFVFGTLLLVPLPRGPLEALLP
jgi:putative tricarboxylic transport membrane protein